MNETGNGNKSKSPLKEKLGLALSGGGFRASFFHIGVLASLAEHGILKEISVISTVSGGSIIGAMYYLRLKELLETKYDYNRNDVDDKDRLNDQDYIDLVQRLEIDFLEGVQKNIRLRVFANIWHNMKMSKPNFSRSDKISQLYDKYFYGDGKIEMRCLKILPKGENDSFSPEIGNESRKAKVPILIINATTLNTGHNWRFQASRMGVAPYEDYEDDKNLKEWRTDVDKNLSLIRPKSWKDTPPSQDDLKLGDAVAASACVPGIFHPLAISDMYERVKLDDQMRDLRVELVDGGVYDNLGTAGLMYKGCKRFIVSDASGQLKDDPEPSTNLLSVIARTNSILMDRVREEELFRLIESYGKDKVTFMHLRKDLPRLEVNYLGNGNSNAAGKTKTKTYDSCTTTFGVDCKVQHFLSSIRTDLDTFTDIEANALMLDSYLMTEHEFKKDGSLEPYNSKDNSEKVVQWRFGKLREIIKNPSNRFKKHLDVGQKAAFKVFWLAPLLAVPMLAVFLVILYFVGRFGLPYLRDSIYYAIDNWEVLADFKVTIYNTIDGILTFSVKDIFTWKTAGYVAGLAVVVFFPKISRYVNFLPTPRKWVEFIIHVFTRFILPSLATIFIWLHFITFDSLFKWSGKLKRFV